MTVWIEVSNGDRRALSIYLRHYSARKNGATKRGAPNANRFMPPGESLVLLTDNCDALFCWIRQQYRLDGQLGVNCNVFRNEGSRLSSDLILAAMEMAWQKWPGERLFTYVADEKIQSPNPGYCFKMAGWHACGRSSVKGLSLLECPAPNFEAVTI